MAVVVVTLTVQLSPSPNPYAQWPLPETLATMTTTYSRLSWHPKGLGYTLVMTVITLAFVGLWVFEGHYLFTAWFPSLYDEITPINGVMAGGFMTLMLCSALISLLLPRQYPQATTILLIGVLSFGLMLPWSFVTETPLLTVVLLVLVITIAFLITRLHPHESGILPTYDDDVSKPLLGLTFFLVIPFATLAADMQWAQLTRSDAIADRWFYGGYAMYLLACMVYSTIATIDASRRAIAGWVTVFLVGLLGLVSMVYPTALHSLGTIGGALLLLWTIAVAALLLAE